MVKAILTPIRESLYRLFPKRDFDDEDFLQNNYIIKYISIYDHGLSEDEYENIIFFQEDFGDDLHSSSLYERYETFLRDFYLYLYDNTSVYGHMFSHIGDDTYVIYESREEFLSHVLLSIREQLFLEIVLPEYKAVIAGRYDLTMDLMVKKNYHQGLTEITKIVKMHNLHILDA